MFASQIHPSKSPTFWQCLESHVLAIFFEVGHHLKTGCSTELKSVWSGNSTDLVRPGKPQGIWYTDGRRKGARNGHWNVQGKNKNIKIHVHPIPSQRSTSKRFHPKSQHQKTCPSQRSTSNKFPSQKSTSIKCPSQKSTSNKFPSKKSTSNKLPSLKSTSKKIQKQTSKIVPIKTHAPGTQKSIAPVFQAWPTGTTWGWRCRMAGSKNGCCTAQDPIKQRSVWRVLEVWKMNTNESWTTIEQCSCIRLNFKII